MTAAMSGRREDWWLSTVFAAVAIGLATALVALGCRGSDFPAQLFRADLFRRHGFVVWDSQWFGGHPTLPYSILAPAVSALVGPVMLAVVSGGVSAALFDRITRSAFAGSRLLASSWFALGTVTNVVIGRVTFALGITLGLAAILSLQTRHRVLGLLCAACCSAASPVAGVFLVVGATGWCLAVPASRRLAIATVAAALVPLAVVGVLFPPSGAFPYEGWAVVCDLAVCAGCVLMLPRRYRVLRRAAVVYAAVVSMAYVMSTPLGGNVSRLSQCAAGPILVGTLGWRRRWVPLLAAPLLFWQWFPAVDALAFARRDPSTEAAYYRPLIDAIRSRPGLAGRTEIPFTYRHWETYFAATELPLARGWERQLDIAYNPMFYRSFSAAEYHRWLHENGVRFVALPDARLDDSSTRERTLLDRQPSFLELLWHNDHWRLWAVRDFKGLADGRATISDVSGDRFIVTAPKPGPLTVRVRSSNHWAVEGAGCVSKSTDGWVHLQVLRAGRLEVRQALRGTHCPTR